MSGQRTQQASPKRIREFRQRGEIATSRDLIAVATLGGGAIAGFAASGLSTTAFTSFTETALRTADGNVDSSLASAAATAFAQASTPAIVGALVACLAAALAQLGWPPAFRLPGFDVGRLFSPGAIAEAFSPKAAARRLFTASAKLAVVASVIATVIATEISHGLTVISPAQLGPRLLSAATRIGIAAAFSLAALACLDWVLARRRLQSKMKMTSDEVRREHKESEGDPAIKGKRRARMRELAKRRISAEVRGADVVVVNPTHYAVALRYRASEDAAPKVVAKGADDAADHIRTLARSCGVPVLSRPPLARALFRVAEGGQVPAPLYRAVAEVLAYVYRLRPQLAPAHIAPRGNR